MTTTKISRKELASAKAALVGNKFHGDERGPATITNIFQDKYGVWAAITGDAPWLAQDGSIVSGQWKTAVALSDVL